MEIPTTHGVFRDRFTGEWHIRLHVCGLVLILGPYKNIEFAKLDYIKYEYMWRD